MPAHPSRAVQSVSERVAEHMTEILDFFKPGAKITILVRRPEAPDGRQDFMLTNDTIDAAMTALEQRKNPAQTQVGDVS